jgi:hypothetical protein
MLDRRLRVPSPCLLRMTTTQIVISVFVVLIGALLLPLSYAARMFLFLLLIGVAVLTFIAGGMQYIASMF